MEEEKVITGYKGFDKDMKCRGFQYEAGKEYETDEAVLCEKGFHFCENPHDVFGYYPAGEGNRFALVEAKEVSDERENDSKRVCKKLKINAEISVFDICKMAVRIFFENFGFKKKIESADTANAGNKGAANAGYKGAANAGNYGAANAGDYGAANAGNYGAANAGNYGAANAGNYGAANAGNCGAANAGYKGAANAGNYGAANAGNCGAANAGYKGAANAGNKGAANAGNYGAANAGDYGAANAGNCGAANAGYKGAANAGDYGAANAGDCGAANAGYYGAANAGNCGAANAGDCGAAIVSNGGKVKGGFGCILVARSIEWDKDGNRYVVTDWACGIVDGVNIKEDTWYHLVNGKLVECEEQ